MGRPKKILTEGTVVTTEAIEEAIEEAAEAVALVNEEKDKLQVLYKEMLDRNIRSISDVENQIARLN